MKQTVLKNRSVQLVAACLVADSVVFSVVNPRQASAAWLIIGFILLGLTVFAAARLPVHLFRPEHKRARKLSSRASYYGASAIVALVGLQSIGQLTARDVLTLLPLVVLGYSYVAYAKKAAAD